MSIQWLFKYSRQFQRCHGAKSDINQSLLIYFGTHLITVVYGRNNVMSKFHHGGIDFFRFVSSVLCFIHGSPQSFCQLSVNFIDHRVLFHYIFLVPIPIQWLTAILTLGSNLGTRVMMESEDVRQQYEAAMKIPPGYLTQNQQIEPAMVTKSP